MDIVIAYFKPGREEIGRYSKSHRKTTVDLHVLEGRHGGIRDLGSFLEAGLHLGIVRGVFYGDPAMRLLASPSFKAQIEEVSTNRQNLKKLLVGRLDGIIVNPFTASEFMRETDAVGKLERRSPVLRTDVYFFFSKVSVTDEVVDAIDRAIETLSQDGTIDKILARYLE